jgi:hypothetical protein
VFVDSPFNDSEAAQDLKLNGSKEWFLRELNTASESIPLRKRKQSRSTAGLMTIISIFELVGIPALAGFLGFNISLDSYNLVERSLGTVMAFPGCINVSTQSLYQTAMPFARKYLE